ncbi:MAG TPA: hypothetical protein VMS37_06620 [Verrucomicrobiae bacterium]|nr:hypothetical protein [Verrucomicrobiae bacterium]
MPSSRTLIGPVLIAMLLLCGTGIASAQTIGASPQVLNFVYQIGGPNPPAQNLYLSADSPAQFAVTISGAPWLTVSPTAGITPISLIASVTAPANATPGTQTGSIIIGPPASTDALRTVVTVNLQILAAPQGNLVVNPNSLTFDYQIGGPFPQGTYVSITSTGAPASFNLSTTTYGSSGWLAVSTTAYVTPATAYVTVIPLPTMGPGVYSGAVMVTPNYAGGVAVSIPVTLRVASAGTLVASPSFLSFSYQSGGNLPPPQTVGVGNSTGGAVPFTVSATTTSGGNWLAYTPPSGTTPFSVVISVNPTTLGPGVYYGTVNLVPTASNVSSSVIPVTLTVYGVSQLIADPASLTFNYAPGGAAPPLQYVAVTSTSSPVNFNVSVSGLSWVKASIASGTTPTGFSVSATPPSNAAPGTYNANILLTPTSGGGGSVNIPVAVKVSAPNYLNLSRTSVTFEYSTSGVNPAPVVVSVTSTNGPLQFEAFPSVTSGTNWLAVSQTSTYTPANLTITVQPKGLNPGTYTGSILINSEDASNGQQTIGVTLTVTSSPAFQATPYALVFSYQMGTDAPAPQIFTVSSGSKSVPFTASVDPAAGTTWLLVVGRGDTPAAAGVGVNASGLGPGTYIGKVLVKSTDGSAPTLEVPVVLNVAPGPVYLPGTNLVAFQYQINGPVPASQKVAINASGNNGALVYYTSVLTADGGKWLTVAPDIGSTPSSLTVSINPQGLTAGLYYGLIGVSDPGAITPSAFVPVTLQVSSGPMLNIPSQTIVLTAQAGIGGTDSGSILVQSSGGTYPFHVTTSGGLWLSASPTDGYTNYSVNVVASASGMAVGYYLGVVTVGIPGAPDSVVNVPVVFTVAPGYGPGN